MLFFQPAKSHTDVRPISDQRHLSVPNDAAVGPLVRPRVSANIPEPSPGCSSTMNSKSGLDVKARLDSSDTVVAATLPRRLVSAEGL